MTARLPHVFPGTPAITTLLRQGHAWMDRLAALEGWSAVLLADLHDRLRRQPAATVADTVEHFRHRLNDAEERERERLRAVRPSVGWCPGCHGECVGTHRSCMPGYGVAPPSPIPEVPQRVEPQPIASPTRPRYQRKPRGLARHLGHVTAPGCKENIEEP
ncbi:hypothetical protein [Cupriavidus metallidurans]|uniref:Uncharacterized protein n=1 Tax=Cupriavidus metallidurans (strain ATCC 43123 / DSM 2839 / NBRC 102507 / CH34) TaxID=266264 RepID=Q1LLT6_CUPMC|nr:hypothetical protein [Cupriavidus metallidurans]ABF08890.1 hypothetical protein Rmet_2011 [Cupriavidus metallidurans CH34]QGS30208.1 hypothetical protein FOB83_15665 [Cupriavidus metallidurans]